MTAIGGYESDVDLNDLRLIEDFPADKLQGGFGTTTGGASAFQLELTPALSEYKKGLLLSVRFHRQNSGTASLNVDGLGAVFMKKVVLGPNNKPAFADPEQGDLNNLSVYLLLFDGFRFQILSGIENRRNLGVPQATEGNSGIASIGTEKEVESGTDDTKIVTPLKLRAKIDGLLNREEELVIGEHQITDRLTFGPGRNRYRAINGNLIVSSDIVLINEPNEVPRPLEGHILNFPRPALRVGAGGFSFLCLTTNGNPFWLKMDGDGRVYAIRGIFTDLREELIVDLKPYIAKYPLEYHTDKPR